MTKDILRFAGATKRFRSPSGESFPAVDAVDARIPNVPGVTAVVGPDGAGKTTLLELAAGLLAPDEGVVEVCGRVPDPEDPAFLAEIGFMPQRFGLYEDLSVSENFRLFAELRGLDEEEAAARFRELMTLTGLAGFEDRLAGKLSGGMKQKLGLAASLLGRPKLLILDEPTVGVDPLSRRELWRILEESAARHGMHALVSTAYLDEAARADRVLLMERGRIAAAGDPGELADAVRGRVRRAVPGFEADEKIFARALMQRAAAAERGSPILDVVPRGREAHLVLTTQAQAEERLSDFPEMADARLEPRDPTLEDAYAALLFPSCGEVLEAPADPEPAEALPDGRPAIEAKALTKRFGAFTAVAESTFTVERGEIFGILGPNGAGKTTTFRMLCGLLVPTTGEVRVAGADPRRSRADARRRVGYVAQKFSLYGRLTVEENLRYFGEAYGIGRRALGDRVEALLAAGGLEPVRRVRTERLSPGAKRALALACALVHRPPILFLDEATSGADPAARRAFWRRIVRLSEGGTTVVATTHFMEEAEYCDRFLIQDAGRTLFIGTPVEIRRTTGAADLDGAFCEIVRRSRGGAS